MRASAAPYAGPPSASRELTRELPQRFRDAPPGELTTLASVVPGQTAEVRTVLSGAGSSAALLCPGDRVVCRDRTAEWLVVELQSQGELTIHHHDARHVQIERRVLAFFR